MNDELYSTRVSASRLNIPNQSFLSRAYSLGLEGVANNKNLFWTNEQIEKVKAYRKKRVYASDISIEKREEIINYWKMEKENQSPKIALVFGLSCSMINCIIDKHIKEIKL